MTSQPQPTNLLAQLLDPNFVVCTCQVRTVDPYDCKLHGHMFKTRKM